MPAQTLSQVEEEAAAAALARRRQKKKAVDACASNYKAGISLADENGVRRPTVVLRRRGSRITDRRLDARQNYVPERDSYAATRDDTSMRIQFSRQDRKISTLKHVVYATPGPSDYDNQSLKLVRPQSARATLNGSARREELVSVAPPPSMYTPRPIRPRSPSAYISLSRPPNPPPQNTMKFYVPDSDFNHAKNQSWSMSRRFSASHFRYALRQSKPSHPPKQLNITSQHNQHTPKARAPRRRVAMVHEIVSRRIRAWAIIVWTIDAHYEFYRRTCIYRVCSRLVNVMQSIHEAKMRAFIQWRKATIEHVQHVATSCLLRHFWHIRLTARGHLKTRAIHIIKDFLVWAMDGPVVVKQMHRFLERVRKIQIWWKHTVRIYLSMVTLWVHQWRSLEDQMRNYYLTLRNQSNLPFHVLWHVEPQHTWRQALFHLGSDLLLVAHDISTDEQLIKVQISQTTWMDDTMIPHDGSKEEKDFLELLIHQDPTKCLLVTGKELNSWRLKLNLAIGCHKILANEIDPNSLHCQLRLKEMRKIHNLPSHEINGILSYFIGDKFRARPRCSSTAMHQAIRSNYQKRREKYLIELKNYENLKKKYNRMMEYKKFHPNDFINPELLKEPILIHFKSMIPSNQLQYMIEEEIKKIK